MTAWLRRCVVTLTVLTAALAAVAVPAHAEAANQGPDRTGSISSPSIHLKAAKVAGVAVECRYWVTAPRFYPDFWVVEGYGQVTCNVPVPEAHVTVTVFREGSPAGSPVDGVTFGGFSTSAYAYGPCVPGTYYTTISVSVTYPVGTVPPVAHVSDVSGGVSLGC